jgi:NitT/TauT family transport system substrate-binding protein
VRKLIVAHVAAVEWTRAHPVEAQRLVVAELQKRTKQQLPERVMTQAWSRVDITWDPLPAALQKQLGDGRALGYLPAEGSGSGLIDRRLLDEVTAGK